MNPRHWLALLTTAGLFGSSFFFIKLSVAEIPPVSLAAGRSLIAALVIGGVMVASGGRLPRDGGTWAVLGVVGGLTGVVPYAAIAFGQTLIESSLAGILFATIPVFTVALAPLVLADERWTPARLAGVVVGLGGVTLVIGPRALGGLSDQLLGAGLTLLAALSYALGGIYARRHAEIGPVLLAAGQLITASVVLGALSLGLDQPWRLAPSAGALTALGAVGVLSTALPVLLLFWLISRVGATNASLLAFFMPVAAILLGTLILDEPLGVAALAGLALIFAGAALVNRRAGEPATAAAD